MSQLYLRCLLSSQSYLNIINIESDKLHSIFYHSCVNHLFRPFVRVTFKEGEKQGTKAPRQICTEAAITISQLLRKYSFMYGLRRAYLILAHCAMSSAIIHLLNMYRQNPNPILTIQASEHLLEIIAMLQEMLPTFPIVARYLKAIHSLAEKWEVDLPPNVRETLKQDFPSPISSDTNPVIAPLSDLTSHSLSSCCIWSS
jgi:hypothetical protein